MLNFLNADLDSITGPFWFPSVSDYISGPVPSVSNLTVDHCLVETVQRVCHVGLSKILLLCVTLCVLVKTVTAVIVTVVLSRDSEAPLATLGDAIASFIQRPDKNTVGMCTLSQTKVRRAGRESRHAILAGPQKWLGKARRRGAVVPTVVWLSSYSLFTVGIGAILYFLVTSYLVYGL